MTYAHARLWLGIGVDDVFVVTLEFDRLPKSDTIEQRIALVLLGLRA